MSGYEIVTGPGVVFDSFNVNGGTGEDTATCSAGKKVVGGGHTTEPPKGMAIRNYPSSTGSWTVTVHVDAFRGATLLKAYAICVFAS